MIIRIDIPNVPRIVPIRRTPEICETTPGKPMASEWSERAAIPRPDCRKPWERIFDHFDRPRRSRTRPERRIAPPRRAYRPRDGNQAGPLFNIYCRRAGVVLGRCRGTLHHVLGEAHKLARSMGGSMADVYVRIADEV